MLFGTGPSAGSAVGAAGPQNIYSPYSHASAAALSTGSTSQASPPSFIKSALHPALMNSSSLLHVTGSPVPNSQLPSQSELIASLNSYHHHHHHHQQQQQQHNHQQQPQQQQLQHHLLDGSMGSVRNSAPTCADKSCKASVVGGNSSSSRESPGASNSSSHHRAHTASPSSSSGGGSTSVHHGNQNEVRTCMLYGIPIVSLVMDGQERLCLAQISNTLLKSFSYNEIHNRRVALGITCVQCTPVQLELLRRAGAMPVSSRRCGMITKRESERLCKSFLAEAEPPKLPDSFAFDVYHSCAWGCRGSFTPSRYNSSRAKCIKCIYCGLFFSPNKFIFHSHRLPTSKYIQPDAANFNSWRRHIRLVSSPEPPEHVSYAWEDVKAMFNGGSRKRAMSSTLNSFTKNQESNSKANAASKHEQANKYKYSDDNSGLDDSDDYCSLDGPPQTQSTTASAASHLQSLTSNKKMVLTGGGGQSSNDSDQGTNSNSQQQLEELEHRMNSPPVHCMSTAAGAGTAIHHHPYHPFAQINSKSIFESHFKKAFEVNSVGGCQTKSMEAENRKLDLTGNQQHSPPHHLTASSSSSLVSISPPVMKHQTSSEPPTTTDHSKTMESMMMHSPPFSSPSAAVLPPNTGHAAYLAAAAAAAAAAANGSSEQQATLMANYNGLFGGHPFGGQRAPAPAAALQLGDPRVLHSAGTTHPAILSTLLNGMTPETAMTATQHQQLRAASNYMQMAPTMMAAGASGAVSSASSTTGSDLTGPPPTDFRHNLAEFMWSMAASKAAGPTPYSFFWPHAAAAAAAATSVPSLPPHPLGMSAGAPLGTTNTSQTSSSSTSSTPTLSPNHVPPTSGDSSSVPNLSEPNGGLFGHFGKSATANAEDIRKALLLNSGLLHQQQQFQRNVTTQFPPFHPNAGIPFLPNLMGHNLRLMAPNHSSSTHPGYMMTNKENTEGENGLPLSQLNKSPEMRLNSNTSSSSLPPTTLPPFPFRSAFTSPLVSGSGGGGGGGIQSGGSALDRFSSEALLRNQALLFDAYHSGNGGTAARAATTFFNPGLFSGGENSSVREAEKSIDVTIGGGGGDETVPSMFRSMYHSFNSSAAAKASAGQQAGQRPPANGSTKFSRRNLKRTSQDNGTNSSGNKKASSASFKGKPSPRKAAKGGEKLPAFEVSSVNSKLKNPVSTGMNGQSLETSLATFDSSGSQIQQKKAADEEKMLKEQTVNKISQPDIEIICDVEEDNAELPVLECQSSSSKSSSPSSSPSPNPSHCSSPSPVILPSSLGDTVSSPSDPSSSTNQTPVSSLQLVL